MEGRVCYGGLDLSSTTDITSFALVFPPLDEEDKYVVLPYFWIPEDTLDLRVRRDHVHMTYGSGKVFLKRPKVTWFITDTLRNLSSDSVKSTTFVK